MAHVSEGRLRRLADEPAAVSDPERRHVAECPQCAALAAEAAADRDIVGQALSADTPPADTLPPDVDAAWAAIQARLASGGFAEPSPKVKPQRSRRRRRLIAVAAGGLAVVAFAGTAAAADWLPIFRPERVTAVDFDLTSVAALPDLSSYGSVSTAGDWDWNASPDAATASKEAGVDAPVVDELPQGISGSPDYAVLPERTATFTFSAAKAAATAAKTGEAIPSMPAGMDGSQVKLQVGPGVVETWQGKAGPPALVVVRLEAPVVTSSGVPWADLQRYLLAQPGMSPALAAQLRALPADGSTLPIPIPTDLATSRPATVNGASATLVQLRDQSQSGVVWLEDGTLNVVAGSLNAEDALAVARGVH